MKTIQELQQNEIESRRKHEDAKDDLFTNKRIIEFLRYHHIDNIYFDLDDIYFESIEGEEVLTVLKDDDVYTFSISVDVLESDESIADYYQRKQDEKDRVNQMKIEQEERERNNRFQVMTKEELIKELKRFF